MRHRDQLFRQLLARCVAFAAALCLLALAVGYLVFRDGVAAEAVGPMMARYLLILAGCSAMLCAAFAALMSRWLRRQRAIPGGEGAGQSIEDGVDLTQRDTLTGVRTGAAFDSASRRLDREIRNGTAEFGLLVVDLNGLGDINLNHGRPKGDLYLKNTCKLLCDIFTHSPVYRIDSDEFVVLLENAGLVARAALVQKFRQGMRTDPYLEPWERVSAAVGLAVYDPGTDADAGAVLARAEQAMRENKKLMKAQL